MANLRMPTFKRGIAINHIHNHILRTPMRPYIFIILIASSFISFLAAGASFVPRPDDHSRLDTTYWLMLGPYEKATVRPDTMCWSSLDRLQSAFNATGMAPNPDHKWLGSKQELGSGTSYNLTGPSVKISELASGRDFYCATYVTWIDGKSGSTVFVEYAKYRRSHQFNLTQDRYNLNLECTNIDPYAIGKIEISLESQTLTKVNVHYTISGSPNAPRIRLSGTPWLPNGHKLQVYTTYSSGMEVVMDCLKKQPGSYQWQLIVHASVP